MANPSLSLPTRSLLLGVLLAFAAEQAHGGNQSSILSHHSVMEFAEAQVLPSFPILSAPISPKVNGFCRNDSHLFLEALANGTLWAVEMFDSSAKFPTGLFGGSTYFLGHFDECLSIRTSSQQGENGISRNFVGKYCLTRFEITKSMFTGIKNDALARIKYTVDSPDHWSLNQFHMASCIPSSCTASDLRTHLSYVIPELDSLKILRFPAEGVEVHLDEDSCSTIEEYKGLTMGQIVMLTLLALLVTLGALGTTVDYFREKNPRIKTGTLSEICLCFSLRRNLKRLMANAEEEFAPMLSLKFALMSYIILTHRAALNLMGATIKMPDLFEGETQFARAIKRNTAVSLEVFLVITGYLHVYLAKTRPKIWINVASMIKQCIRRYIRITPAYMVMLALSMTLFMEFGSGPMWKSVTGSERVNCEKNWWTNVLYMNNVINSERMCMGTTWYLAVDMQLFIISTPVIYLLVNRPKMGKALLGCFLAASVCIPVFVIHYKQLPPQYETKPKSSEIGYNDSLFLQLYTPSYMRGIPYFLGICAGYYVHYFKKSGQKMSQRLANFIHVGIFIQALLGPYVESLIFHDGFKYKGLMSAVYAPLPQIFRATAVLLILHLFAAGKEWFIMRILSWRIFWPLGRLTYCAYLLHILLQIHDIAMIRTAQQFSYFNVVQMALADIIFAFLLAFALSMLVEFPMVNLTEIIIPNDGSKVVREIQQTGTKELKNTPEETME